MVEQDQGEQTGSSPFTYAELAGLLGLSADGARTRAKRQGWRVIRGNDGRSRVMVPSAELPERRPDTAGRTAGQLPFTPELAQIQVERVAELTATLSCVSCAGRG